MPTMTPEDMGKVEGYKIKINYEVTLKDILDTLNPNMAKLALCFLEEMVFQDWEESINLTIGLLEEMETMLGNDMSDLTADSEMYKRLQDLRHRIDGVSLALDPVLKMAEVRSENKKLE